MGFQIKKIICWVVMIFATNVGYANDLPNKKITITMQNVNVKDAIYLIAEQLNLNVILSPDITGDVSLSLHRVSLNDALTMLLTSHDLVKVRLQNGYYVLPRKEWILHHEDQLKLHELEESATPLITRVWQIHYSTSDAIAKLLQENGASLLSKRGHVRQDARTNILCIQDTPEHINAVQQLIKRVDVPIAEVKIATKLASVDNAFERALGLRFDVTASTTPENATTGQGRYSFLLAKMADGSLLDFELSALETQGHAELLSSPELFTMNQQTATIESGEDIPYQEMSLSGGTVIAFKKAVLSLKVTPQVLPGNKVMLELQINQDKPSTLQVQGVPAINTRAITTHVLVNDGETIVLGGIYETNKENNKQGIPFLGKIPGVGILFQQHDTVLSKRELLIFVTPKIIQGHKTSNGEEKN